MKAEDGLAVRRVLAYAGSAARRRPLALWALAALIMVAEGSCLPTSTVSTALLAAGVGSGGSEPAVKTPVPEPAPEPSDMLPAEIPADDAAPGAAQPDAEPRLLGLLCFVLTWFGWIFIAGSLVLPGYLLALSGVLQGQAAVWAALRSGLHRFRDMLGWALLASLLQLGGIVAGALPGLLLVEIAPDGSTFERVSAIFMLSSGGVVAVWVGLGLLFGAWLVALDGRRPVEAFKLAWQLARGRRLRLLWLLAAANLVALAGLVGLVAFGVGIVATAPLGRALGDLMLTRAFLDLWGPRRPAQ